ncbi:MAG: glycosyltransferase [Pyrinomonadaceae bacterium]
MDEETQTAVDMTLLVCTFNRSGDLREMLQTALAQETDGEFAYEVLVVDNNSSDDTRGVVEELIRRGHANLRYLFEGRQGKSHALNTGLSHVRGWAYTICDDDFLLPEDWLKKISAAFHSHPEASFVSGKVLPAWGATGAPPAWLTARHWSAIAMTDYGEEEFYVDEENQLCLLACSFRTSDVKAVGGYHAELGVTKNQIGGTEDFELLQRLWKSGRKGIYLPHIWFHHKVTRERLTKQYHRRWHTGHGRFCAAMRAEEIEKSRTRLFDVPAHLYRQAATDALLWTKCSLRGQSEAAFVHETQLRFFAGFFRKRRADFSAAGRNGTVREVFSFARSLVGKKNPRSSSETV